MDEGKRNRPATSRRAFLVTGAAAVLASSVPARSVRARAGATFLRMNVSDPNAATAVQSYRSAVAAMLKLPPTDARNWYRIAFTHLLDCPHRNWWFLPWHRGYIGWLEQTCRIM